MMIGEESQQDAALEATGREHDLMAQAAYTMERALAAPAPGREAEWRRRAAAALAVVVDLVRQHVDSAEGEGGLVARLEVVQGQGRNVRLAKADHRKMVEDAERLLGLLTAEGGTTVPIPEARKKAMSLADLLRRHRWREADLILDVFGLDVGAGD